jgi:hypothetical protein
MKLNIKAVRKVMLDAARVAADDRWPVLESLAEMQFSKLSTALYEIQRLYTAGKLDRRSAQELAIAEQNVVRGVFAGIRGLGTLTAAVATRAATHAAAADVNAAIGFKLL